MKLSEVREWVREHGATVSVGTIVLNGEQRPAAICAADGKLLAVRVWPGNLRIVPSVFEQSWDWDCGHWDTRFVGELPEGLGMDADELHALITGECPRCNGSGVIESQTRYGAFMVPDLLPCPECQGETADAQPPLPPF